MKIRKARINKEYAKLIQKTVTNYNAKISRLQKKGLDVTLPEKTSVKEITKLLERKQINSRLKELQMFSKRGMEAKTKSGNTVYATKVAKTRLKRAKLSLHKKIAKIENRYYEKYPDETERAMKKRTDDVLTNMKDKLTMLNNTKIDTLTKGELNRKLNVLENILNNNQLRNAKIRNDFINKLTWMGDTWGGNDGEIEKIKNSLLWLDDQEFAELLGKSDELRDIFEKVPSPDRMGTFDTEDFSPLVKDTISNLADIIDDLVDRYTTEEDE